MAKKKNNRGKKTAKTTSTTHKNIVNAVITEAYSAGTPPIKPVFLKVCRLCESKDGPFLNIFDADKVTAKKIDDLMPFSVTENDDLPHKICFRCSAKLEELYEFIQKCIKTQESLRTAVGKSGPFLSKSKMGKKLWEEKLNKSNMSNDDICDALIKKAMEGIKGIPLQPPVATEEPVPETKRVLRGKESLIEEKDTTDKIDDTDEISLKQIKMNLEKDERKSPVNKITRSGKQNLAETEKTEAPQPTKQEPVEPKKPGRRSKKSDAMQSTKQEIPNPTIQNEKPTPAKQSKPTLNNLSFDYDPPPSAPTSVKESDSEEEKKEEPEKPFNIMDYISMIKVNGVGILFQCKLCNRNFLKKEVVESHSCAKNGVPKVDLPKTVPVPDAPKLPSVKYIKIDNDMKKSLTEKVKLAEKTENLKNLHPENVIEQKQVFEAPPKTKEDPPKTKEAPPKTKEAPSKTKSKPKIGPASKTKRNVIDLDSDTSETKSEPPSTPPVLPPTTNPPMFPLVPSINFPNVPNLNSRYKIVLGPNNVFSIVEDTSPLPPVNSQPTSPPVQETKRPSKKRKTEPVNDSEVKKKDQEVVREKSESPEVIDVENQAKPYPVGLFQTVAHSQPQTAAFTTPAMKKQSYTIVQTGNPSKLLISTKASVADAEVPKKRQKRAKPELKVDPGPKQPFTVTLEDVAHPKDTGFFTFINVDPLLQPSYVLPTDNIIQESQISTSSAISRQSGESKESKDKGKYSCNMCGLSFTREKKLLSHIQSHYSKMDEEDQMREEKTTRKRGRK